MILRYLDTHPEHRHLWQQLDSRFLPFVEPRQEPAVYQAELNHYLQQQLPKYAGDQPVLLVWHLHELSTDQRPWRLSRDLWQSWPAHQRIYVVFVSGGGSEVGQTLIQAEALPESHFFALPQVLGTSMGTDWENRWRQFLLRFENSSQADWALLTPPVPTPAEASQNAWRQWRHDLLACLRQWPERKARFQALAERIPDELQDYVTGRLRSQLAILLQQDDLVGLESHLRLLGQQALLPSPADKRVSVLLPDQARRLAAHWQALAEIWRELPCRCQELVNPSAAETQAVSALRELFQTYPRLEQSEALASAMPLIRNITLRLAQRDSAAPLRAILHNGLEQHLYYVAEQVPQIAACLHRQEGLLAGSAQESELERFSRWAMALPQSETLSRRTFQGRSARVTAVRKLNLLIVEDNPLWQADLGDLVDQVSRSSGLQGAILRVCAVGDLAAARQALATFETSEAVLLAIVDLSIPAQAGTEPEAQNGQALLAELTDYTRQAAVIVLSTPGWLLRDQLAMQASGLTDADLLLKSHADELEELLSDWFERLLRRPAEHLLQIQKDAHADTGEVLVDQVPISLTRLDFQFLYTLAWLRQHNGLFQVYSADHLLATVQELFPRFELPASLQPVPLEQSPEAQFDKRLEAVLKSIPAPAKDPQMSQIPVPVLADLKRHLRHQARVLWENPQAGLVPALICDAELLDLMVARYEALADLAPLSDQTASRLRFFVPDGQAVRLQRERGTYVSDHLYRIRETLHAELKSAGRSALPDEMVWGREESRTWQNTQAAGYAIAENVSIVINDITVLPPRQRPVRVLLVENDPLYVQEISEILERHGLEVRLAPHLEAVLPALQEALPDLVILDLHIPLTADAYALDPLSGHEAGGLKALERIQAANPACRTLILSQLSDRDDLRYLAYKLQGLRNLDCVVKGRWINGEDWMGLFQLQLQRVLRELRDQGRLQASLATLPPLSVTVLDYADSPRPQLLLDVSGRRSLFTQDQARWMRLLLCRVGHWVAPETLIREVYDQDPETADLSEWHETLKQKLKHLRRKIREDWFAEPLAADVLRKQVLMTQRFAGVKLEVHQLLDPDQKLFLPSASA